LFSTSSAKEQSIVTPAINRNMSLPLKVSAGAVLAVPTAGRNALSATLGPFLATTEAKSSIRAAKGSHDGENYVEKE
jgi:hypothetical protein